ncbi:unnamed protein product [Phaedon cochleariae]|uniref:Major facilitator superfamily (MFS) profile domain-containing protein n=1 Tax=Phaedon cochleariae TaxID=80249 RepID=A0A9N9X1G5_PHACE|nr:unnamed protein product [Phaedon cochleariae]
MNMSVSEEDKSAQKNDDGKEWPQILAILLGCLSSLTGGLLFAWPSPFLPKIINDKSYNITQDEASNFTTFNTVGIIVLSPFLILFTDSFGRKKTLMFSAIPTSVAWIIKAFSKDLYWLYFARFSCGLGDAILFAALPIYIGEVASPKVRGTWGNALICSVFLGQFIMNVLGYYFSIETTSFICLALPVTFVLVFSLMPETPYFYMMKGNEEAARQSLRTFKRKHNVDAEFEELKSDVRRQMVQAGTWRNLFMIEQNRKGLIAAVFLRTSQMFGGLLVFASYTKFIFEKSGGNIDPSLSSIIYMGTSFSLYTLSAFFSDTFGRRKAYMTSLALSGLVLLIEGIYLYIDQYQPGIDLSGIKWFPLAGLLGFIVTSSFGLGIIPTLMLGELFSASIKAKGVSLTATNFGLMILLANVVFYETNKAVGLYGPFIVFGCCNILSTFISYFVLPETKGKTLDEIQQHLKTEKVWK